MLQRNAISEISPDTPGFYSNTFMVRKASGGWRPVIDSKQLNHHIDAPHFRMHTISSVLSTIKKGDYAFKIDLQDVYFHVLIHPHSRKYQFRVLHFSLNTAPQVFICLRHRVAAYLHHQGISVIPYLDDWLIHHPDRQVLLRHQSQLLNILNMVGLRLNEAKSRTRTSFWGFHYSWIRGELPSQYPKLGRYGTRMPNILPEKPCRTEKCPNLWNHSIGPQVSSHWVIYTIGPYNTFIH